MPQNSAPAQPPVSIAVAAERLRFGAGCAAATAEVAVEMPISIVYGDVPYAVMMASPADLEDFVTGFSLTEGVIERPDEIRTFAIAPEQDGMVVRIDLVPSRFREHLARRRNLTGRTSCGLCGVEDRSAIPQATAPVGRVRAIAPEAIARAIGELEQRQPLNQLTRAVHGAAWCGSAGDILAVREDVGRHNALDKLIGACLRSGIGPAGGFLLVTSRASFEMVEKAAIFGAATLVTISAPTSLAIERADRLGVTLVSIARRDGAVVFTGALAQAEVAP